MVSFSVKWMSFLPRPHEYVTGVPYGVLLPAYLRFHVDRPPLNAGSGGSKQNLSERQVMLVVDKSHHDTLKKFS